MRVLVSDPSLGGRNSPSCTSASCSRWASSGRASRPHSVVPQPPAAHRAARVSCRVLLSPRLLARPPGNSVCPLALTSRRALPRAARQQVSKSSKSDTRSRPPTQIRPRRVHHHGDAGGADPEQRGLWARCGWHRHLLHQGPGLPGRSGGVSVVPLKCPLYYGGGFWTRREASEALNGPSRRLSGLGSRRRPRSPPAS